MMLCGIDVCNLGLFCVGVIGLAFCFVVCDVVSNFPSFKKMIPYDED